MEGSSNNDWSVARFPSAGSKQDFLDRLKLLSRIEDRSPIEAEPLRDGTRVRLRSRHKADSGVRRLVDCFGGRAEIT